MFDGAWAEFILLGIIALIFLGPRELISLCRTAGRFVGKLKMLQETFMDHIHTAAHHDEEPNGFSKKHNDQST